jgi:hypothetical protein
VLESVRLIFIVLGAACYCCCAGDKAEAVPYFLNHYKTMTWLVGVVVGRQKKAGFPLP